jgi:3-hydroxyacyl-CoA dehydrogenase
VFARLNQVVKSAAVLASNTSYLNINEIASVTARPENVLGMHFFSPANIMKLLEVVRGAKTSPIVVATVMALARTIGKIPVVAGVGHGFIGNRILARRQEQANRLILEGARPSEVDRVLVDFGMPMGPFQMADLAGLDVGWHRDPTIRRTVRDILCAEGRLGQKTNAGFYDYNAQRRPSRSELVERLIADIAAAQGIEQRAIGAQEIIERCLYPMVNEGAKILEEGIAQRGSDIDLVWVNGYGWPTYRGGPMFWADTIGLDTVISGLKRYSSWPGSSFTLSSLLETKTKLGERLSI